MAIRNDLPMPGRPVIHNTPSRCPTISCWIRWISSLLPVTYALDGMRKSLLASASLADVLPDVAALAAFAAVLLPLSLVAFRLAVRKAKRDGTLSHY